MTGNPPRDGVRGDPEIELTFETEVAAPRSRLFAALTEARHLEHWFCARATSDPRPGGELIMAWDGSGASAEPFRGQWTAVTPPDACGYHGGHTGYPDGDAGSVMFELEPLAAGTRLRTRHTLPEAASKDAARDTAGDPPVGIAGLRKLVAPRQSGPA